MSYQGILFKRFKSLVHRNLVSIRDHHYPANIYNRIITWVTHTESNKYKNLRQAPTHSFKTKPDYSVSHPNRTNRDTNTLLICLVIKWLRSALKTCRQPWKLSRKLWLPGKIRWMNLRLTQRKKMIVRRSSKMSSLVMRSDTRSNIYQSQKCRHLPLIVKFCECRLKEICLRSHSQRRVSMKWACK